jgi:hypothetical protein
MPRESVDHLAKMHEILRSDSSIELLKIYLNGATELDLANTLLAERDIINLCEALKYNTSVTKLSLYNTGLGAQDVAPLVALLKVNVTLKSLDLSANELGGIGLSKLAFAIANMSDRDMSKFTLLAQNNGLTKVSDDEEKRFWGNVLTEQGRRFNEGQAAPAVVWYYPACTSAEGRCTTPLTPAQKSTSLTPKALV